VNSRYTLHRLSLLEQWHLDSFRLLFSIALMLIFSVIIIWILPLISHGSIHDGVIGMLCGLLIGFWFTCIARLHIHAPIDADNLVSILESYKYRKTPQGYYDLQIHRYAKFKAQRVFIEKQDGAWVLIGPYNILEKIINQIDKGLHSNNKTTK